MTNVSKNLLASLRKEKTARPSFWFMRQAGRYLPEYRELRSKANNFLDFCYAPSMACEATLQPIRRFGMDGAIIFSDILVVPHALGADVRFEEGHGPVLKPVQTLDDLKLLGMKHVKEKLTPVYEALKMTAAKLPGEAALIGFVGAPWTLACYTIQGRAGRDFEMARLHAVTNKTFFTRLMALLSEAVTE